MVFFSRGDFSIITLAHHRHYNTSWTKYHTRILRTRSEQTTCIAKYRLWPRTLNLKIICTIETISDRECKRWSLSFQQQQKTNKKLKDTHNCRHSVRAVILFKIMSLFSFNSNCMWFDTTSTFWAPFSCLLNNCMRMKAPTHTGNKLQSWITKKCIWISRLRIAWIYWIQYGWRPLSLLDIKTQPL